jgi:hypothetical protein
MLVSLPSAHMVQAHHDSVGSVVSSQRVTIPRTEVRDY